MKYETYFFVTSFYVNVHPLASSIQIITKQYFSFLSAYEGIRFRNSKEFSQSDSLFLVNQWLSLYGIYRATLSFLVSLCSVIHSNSRLVKLVGSSSIEQGFELCRKATESQFLHLSLYLLSWWLDSVFVSSIASWHSLQLIGEGWFCFLTLCCSPILTYPGKAKWKS